MPAIYSEETRKKIGNAIVFIVGNVRYANMFDILQLVYLMEETMVRIYPIPFFAVRYEAWASGPVQPDIRSALSGKSGMLEGFIRPSEKGTFEAEASFDKDEFSDAELGVMHDVIERHESMNPSDRNKVLLQKGTPWALAVVKDGKQCYGSEIDLSVILSGKDMAHYLHALSQKRETERLKFIEPRIVNIPTRKLSFIFR